MARIRMIKGDRPGATYEISQESLVIGRDKGDQVQILDQGASRQHAEIFRIGELYFLRDLQSKNGTFLNEEPIAEQALQIGDKVRIGSTVFQFEDDGSGPVSDAMERRVQYEVDERAPSSTIEISFGKDAGGESGSPIESKHLNVLMKISRLLGTSQGLKPVYERVLKLLLDAVDGNNGYIFEVDAHGALAPVMVVEKESDKTAKVSKTIIKQVMEQHKALLTTDAAMDPRFNEKNSIIIRKTSSVICAPLISHEKLYGVIYLSVSRIMKPFDGKDLELSSVVGIMLGLVAQSFVSARQEKESLMNTVRTLVDIKERRFPNRKGHSERVARYAKAVAAEMGLSQEDLFRVELAAWLHDIGRVSSAEVDGLDDPTAPPEFLRKKSEEFAALAREIARDMKLDKDVMDGIVHHGETLDGKGVPDGLHGLDIPLYARIIAVAKAFDMLASYGGKTLEGVPVKDALIAMNKESGKRYDAEVIQALLVAYRKGALFKQSD